MNAKRAATKLGIQVTATVDGPVTRSLRIEVAVGRVRKAFGRAYRDLGRRVTVRGFRPGKAPRSVLERLYGSSVVEEVERVLVNESLPEALNQTEIEPVAEPDIEADPLVADSIFAYTALVEVKPKIELPDLAGLSAKLPTVSVGEDDVERELEQLRERRSPLVEDTEEATIAVGHVATIDYIGRIEGKSFEGGTGQGVTFEIGAGRFIPGFEEQLVGLTVGSDHEVVVTFPEDYAHEEVAGKLATFSVRVVKIQKKDLPTLDDDFARQLGDFQDLGALREQIKVDLRTQSESAASAELRRTLLDSLLERTSVKVPPGMVERQLRQRLEMAARQLGPALGEEGLPRRIAQWREEWRPQAERDVQEQLLLEAVADEQGLSSGPDEVDERLQRMARDQGIDLTRLKKAYDEPGMREALAASLSAEKALDFLRSEANVEETGT